MGNARYSIIKEAIKVNDGQILAADFMLMASMYKINGAITQTQYDDIMNRLNAQYEEEQAVEETAE